MNLNKIALKISSINTAASIFSIKNEEDKGIEGVGFFIYFIGEPTIDEVIKSRDNLYRAEGITNTDWPSWGEPVEYPDEVSRKAGLSRWWVGPAM